MIQAANMRHPAPPSKPFAAEDTTNHYLLRLSHDLRTPLHTILNFTECVALGMLGDVNDRQRDALEKSLESGRHLLNLINNVLDMTRIEAGVLELFVEEGVDLYNELAGIRMSAETMRGDKAVDYVEDIDADLPPLIGDRRRIRQILLNLVSNAIKFTQFGTITVSVKKRGDEVLFAVIDTGCGIAPHDQHVIFEPLTPTGPHIQEGGTGLGLTISRYLVEAHGGRIWLESEPGQGAAFYFTLPVRPPALIARVFQG